MPMLLLNLHWLLHWLRLLLQQKHWWLMLMLSWLR
jgi:hypothetical protein